MTDERKVHPAAIIGIGLGLGVAAALGIYALAGAAPPEVYTCPVCAAEFGTLEELQEHFTTAHPRQPLPIEWE